MNRAALQGDWPPDAGRATAPHHLTSWRSRLFIVELKASDGAVGSPTLYPDVTPRADYSDLVTGVLPPVEARTALPCPSTNFCSLCLTGETNSSRGRHTALVWHPVRSPLIFRCVVARSEESHPQPTCRSRGAQRECRTMFCGDQDTREGCRSGTAGQGGRRLAQASRPCPAARGTRDPNELVGQSS